MYFIRKILKSKKILLPFAVISYTSTNKLFSKEESFDNLYQNLITVVGYQYNAVKKISDIQNIIDFLKKDIDENEIKHCKKYFNLFRHNILNTEQKENLVYMYLKRLKI